MKSSMQNDAKISVGYYIQRPNSNKSILLLNVSYEGIKIMMSSGLSVKPADWDKENQKVKKSDPEAAAKNEYFNNLKHHVLNTYYSYKRSGAYITKDEMKVRIKEFIIPANKAKETYSKKKSVTEWYEQFNNERMFSGVVKPKTTERHKTSVNHLKAFEVFISKKIDFNDLDERFALNLHKYLTQNKEMVNNSALTVFKSFRVFLNWASDRGLPVNPKTTKSFNKVLRSYKVKSSSDSVALTKEEVKTLYDMDLTKNKRLEKTRDIFIIQCYTSLRFSDVSKLTSENFDMKRNLIILDTVKTEDSLLLPIHDDIKPILEKYHYTIPSISNQKYNEYLKELCKQAGINDPVKYPEYYGKKRKDVIKLKYEMVSSHTGRRTMITNALLSGMLPEEVMKFSGHRNRQSFDSYVKRTQDQAIQRYYNMF
jgi:integrase